MREASRLLFASLLVTLGVSCGGDETEYEHVDVIEPNAACGLTCGLELSGTWPDLVATVSIENPGQHSAQLLEWDLPRDGEMTRSLFVVSRGGLPVAYRGKQVKRAAPRGEDYMTVPPGYRLAADIAIGDGYDLEPAGGYTLHYRTTLLFGGPGKVCELTSNRVELSR